jgi:hypothetical protein
MIKNAEASCRTISMIAQVKAYDVKQRGVHQWVMMFDVQPASVEWRRPLSEEYNTAECDGLCLSAYRLGVEDVFRWTIQPVDNKSPFLDSCWLVGRCDTLEEAILGAEKALGVLLKEAQE